MSLLSSPAPVPNLPFPTAANLPSADEIICNQHGAFPCVILITDRIDQIKSSINQTPSLLPDISPIHFSQSSILRLTCIPFKAHHIKSQHHTIPSPNPPHSKMSPVTTFASSLLCVSVVKDMRLSPSPSSQASAPHLHLSAHNSKNNLFISTYPCPTRFPVFQPRQQQITRSTIDPFPFSCFEHTHCLPR